MGRSENQEVKNPAQRWFEWSGSEGKIRYYDRDKKENVFVELPFSFLVLDQLNTITGFSDADQSSIWANEVKDIKTEKLTVRTKLGIKKTGYYEQVKDVQGARFTKSIYIAFFDGDDLKIGNFKACGSALGAWFEFTKSHKIYEGAVKIVKAEQAKKGATKYFVPVFEPMKIKPETEAQTDKLYEEVKAYLTTYLARNGAENTERGDSFPTHTGGEQQSLPMTANRKALLADIEAEFETVGWDRTAQEQYLRNRDLNRMSEDELEQFVRELHEELVSEPAF